MNNNTKIFLSILVVLSLMSSYNMIYTDSMDIDDDTLIISLCTGNMRGLEIGVSVYAGYNKVPLILSDKTLPEEIYSWLPDYVHKNNITKIIIAGSIEEKQLLDLCKLGVSVEQIRGDSISEILVNIAENNENKNNNTLIFTASDPLAGILGAYTNTPVFITASNSTYSSSEYLDSNYVNYIETHNISHVIIVGSLPQTLMDQIKSYNVTIEELSGSDSKDMTININNKLKSLGYLNSTATAYYGFYGELPTIVPLAVENNAMLIEDSSNQGNMSSYLKENNITTVYLTRNRESDYLQMEEEDYISSSIINELNDDNISVKFLTKNRTLDEATGLYDVKIITAENMVNQINTINNSTNGKILKSNPPLLSILEYSSWIDSNNVSTTVSKNNNDYIVKWNTIHPYIWKKIDNTTYYATSNTGYEYYWHYDHNKWFVDYKYNNVSYYNVTWVESNDNSWFEIQPYSNYTWKFDGNKWVCSNNDSEVIYTLSKT